MPRTGEKFPCISERWQEWALEEQCEQLLRKGDIKKKSFQRAKCNYIQDVPRRGSHLYAMNATVNMHVWFFMYHIQKINEKSEIGACLSVCTLCIRQYLVDIVFLYFCDSKYVFFE